MFTDREMIQKLWDYGHFFSPTNPDGHFFVEQQLDQLKLTDAPVLGALRSLHDMMGVDTHELHALYDIQPVIDLEQIRSGAHAILSLPRCGMPDFESPSRMKAIGSGSWPQPCQKEGVVVAVDTSNMPASLRGIIDAIIDEAIQAYAEIGLRIRRDDSVARPNMRMSWERLGGSVIGLAEFNNRQCDDSVFCKFDPGYTSLMWSLITHEWGHNCNLSHTRGGVMNPSIMNVTPHKWNSDDPSYATLMRYFGGEPVPGPTPPVPPVPGPETIARGEIEFFVGVQSYGKFIMVPKPEV